MPMQLTVSRNRKTSANYNSEGHGISFTVEFDQALVARPDELQKKIDYLYKEAELALDRQTGSRAASSSAGNTNGGNGTGPTTAQLRAVHAIGKRLGLDVGDECYHEIGTELKQLSVRQASEFIDHLKAFEQPAARNGGAR